MAFIIAWLGWVALEAYIQYIIIEKKKRYPVKLTYFIIRVAVGGLYLWWALALGYSWLMTVIFILGTFWYLFPALLNQWRGKDPAYLSPTNSWYDRMVVKILGAFVEYKKIKVAGERHLSIARAAFWITLTLMFIEVWGI